MPDNVSSPYVDNNDSFLYNLAAEVTLFILEVFEVEICALMKDCLTGFLLSFFGFLRGSNCFFTSRIRFKPVCAWFRREFHGTSREALNMVATGPARCMFVGSALLRYFTGMRTGKKIGALTISVGVIHS